MLVTAAGVTGTADWTAGEDVPGLAAEKASRPAPQGRRIGLFPQIDLAEGEEERLGHGLVHP
jgi:hypothetical protein